jgi:UDP-glucose:(heptosyl)LPS alpha-1,3-glucosyltransferase
MKLAFSLFNYFPFGGLQRDFLRIANICKERDHQIDVFTMSWEGHLEPGFNLQLVKVKGLTNHARCAHYINQLNSLLHEKPYDLHIGFNKMPGLDIYYAADGCFKTRVDEKHPRFYQLLPRYQHYLRCEKAVFTHGNQTKILLIAPQQKMEYQKYYQTEDERFHLLPPGISKDRIAPANASQIRQLLRKEYHVGDNEFLLLFVGSGFKTKGLDRAIIGLAALPDDLKARCHFFVIGQDNPKSFLRLAKKYQIENKITFLGGRENIAEFFLAADLLLHPAYFENTGTVLLEAMISGLPVLTTEACGYAQYVRNADAGIVLSAPFQQSEFNLTLQKMLLFPEQKWQQNGLAFAQKTEIYTMPEKAADFIEQELTRKCYI